MEYYGDNNGAIGCQRSAFFACAGMHLFIMFVWNMLCKVVAFVLVGKEQAFRAEAGSGQSLRATCRLMSMPHVRLCILRCHLAAEAQNLRQKKASGCLHNICGAAQWLEHRGNYLRDVSKRGKSVSQLGCLYFRTQVSYENVMVFWKEKTEESAKCRELNIQSTI